MGWSADENYMKQLSGKIGSISKITSQTLLSVPVATTQADVISNGVLLAENNPGTSSNRRLYVGCNKPGGVTYISYVNGDYRHAAFLHPDNTAKFYVAFASGVDFSSINYKSDIACRTAVTGYTGVYCGECSNYVIGPSYTYYGTPIITGASLSATGASAMAYCTLQTGELDKTNDGFCAIAWVKYKTTSTTISQTPFLISSQNSYTFFSGAHNETFSALYQGKRFYFSFSYSAEDATPFSILTLNYTGSDYPVMSPAMLFNYVANSVSLTVTETGDPWGDTPSEPGGGDGGSDTGDDIGFSTPPSSSAVASGFVTLFTPDLTTLNAVAAYMWSSNFDIDQIKKIFANPIDAILGLHIVPCAITPAGQKEIKVAGFGTGQYSGYTTNQYVTVNCGSVAIPKKWGSYLDYSPYTKTQIWLPFIGFREINIDDIQGKTISLQYIIDILSGACVAEVLIPCDDGTTSVLYSFTGSCAAEIPITSADMRGAISAAMSIAGSAVAAAATVASGGATAPMAAGVIASTAVNSMALKPTIQRSGTASGAAGYLAQRIPYIVREQPNIALPAEQNKLTGYPSFVTVSLNTLSGYNEIANIHLENVPGTDAELSEIENLLHSGVIF